MLLTTQDLDEADALAARIVVIDQGRVVADDTPAKLKASAGAGTLSCKPGGRFYKGNRLVCLC